MGQKLAKLEDINTLNYLYHGRLNWQLTAELHYKIFLPENMKCEKQACATNETAYTLYWYTLSKYIVPQLYVSQNYFCSTNILQRYWVDQVC